MIGKVKRFNDKKGFGFINSDEVEKDIFFHYSDIKMDGFKTLYRNDVVEFDYNSEKVRAANIVVKISARPQKKKKINN